MKIEIGKTYLTANGRFIKIEKKVWEGIVIGEFEKDGRDNYTLKAGGSSERYEMDGKHWNYVFQSHVFNDPQLDIIMEDCPEARKLAEQMRLERKQKAFEETK